jgi:hypothetical protein
MCAAPTKKNQKWEKISMQSELKSPSKKWGNPRANQVWVRGWYSRRCSKVVPASPGLFGLWQNAERTEMWTEGIEVNGSPPEDFPDNEPATRRFVYQCGIIKAIRCITTDPRSSRWDLWFDGYHSLSLSTVAIECCEALPEDSIAIAEITIEGVGERHGELCHASHTVKLLFKDEQAMRAHCQAVIIQSPAQATPKQQSTIVVTEEISDIWPFIGGVVVGAVAGEMLSQE